MAVCFNTTYAQFAHSSIIPKRFKATATQNVRYLSSALFKPWEFNNKKPCELISILSSHYNDVFVWNVGMCWILSIVMQRIGKNEEKHMRQSRDILNSYFDIMVLLKLKCRQNDIWRRKMKLWTFFFHRPQALRMDWMNESTRSESRLIFKKIAT